MCRYVDEDHKEVHVLLPDSIMVCPRCAFLPYKFTPEDLIKEAYSI